MNDVIKTIATRRSIRNYTAQPVSPEQLNTLLQCAINAPSARNLQPRYFTTLQRPEEIQELADGIARSRGMDHPLHNAPAVIVISGAIDSSWAVTDCSLSAQNIMLAAESLGLGTCFIGCGTPFWNSPEGDAFAEKIQVPKGYHPLFAVTVGYPATTPEPTPRNQDVVSSSC